MNFFMALMVAVSAWLTFSVLNELHSAKGGQGCCQTKDCGTSMIDQGIWWLNLAIAILFTLYILYDVYERYGDKAKAHVSKLVSKKSPVAKGVQMVFG